MFLVVPLFAPLLFFFLLEHAFYLLGELVGVEGVGDDLALAVGDDVVGDMAEAREHEQRRIPHLTVADGAPLQGVARDLTATASDIGIEADAEDLQVAIVKAVFRLELTLDVLTLVVLTAPHADDVALRIEVGGLHGIAVDIGDGEGRQTASFLQVAQTFEALEEHVEACGVTMGLQDGMGEFDGALVVGIGHLDVIAAKEVAGEGRRGVVADEACHGEGKLWGCLVAGLLAELGEVFILVVAADLGFTEVGGVGFEGDLGAFRAEDGQLGEVGEDEHEEGGVFEGYLIVEAPLDDGDGIQGTVTIGAVDIELSLVEAFEGAFEQERLTLLATGDQEQR